MLRIANRAFMVALAVGALGFTAPLVISSDADARGARAGAAGGMRGGGARMSRPSPSAGRSMNRSSVNRNVDRGSVNRDAANRASINRDNISRDGNRQNISRDNINTGDRTNIDRGDRERNVDRGDREFNGGDREINNDIDIDVDDGWDNDWGDHPIAAGVAFGTAAAMTSAVIGSWAYSLPPSCYNGFYGGYTYYNCGNVWYQPAYSGDQVTYVVVEQPAEYEGGATVPAAGTPAPN